MERVRASPTLLLDNNNLTATAHPPSFPTSFLNAANVNDSGIMTEFPQNKRSTNGCGVCRSVHFCSSTIARAGKENMADTLPRRSIRRIKCDETRPSCDQCTKTGRSCEGYRPNSTLSTRKPTRALAPLQATCQVSLSSSQGHLSVPAQRALHYYRVNTAKQLSGYFNDDFWTTLVLQVGDREHCVNYALVALASLHEHFHTEATERFPLTTRQPGEICQRGGQGAWSLPMHRAVSSYAEAVRRLHEKISKGGDEVEATLLCCLLLAAFELLRGYHAAAQVHLHGSASLLRVWQDEQKSQGGGSRWSPRSYFIRERLRPLFYRMALQATLFSHSPPALPSSSQFVGDDASFATSIRGKKKRVRSGETGIRVASPTEARDILYQMIWQLYLLPEGRSHAPKRAQTKQARAKKRNGFIRSLHQWRKALSEYLEEHPINGTSSTILKLFHVAASVIIPTCMSDDQMAFDSFASQFQEMTDLAEHLLFPPSPLPAPLSAPAVGGNIKTSRAPPSPGLLPLPDSQDVPYFFSLDMGVLYLLYYVAIRCRVARTRYRALALLRRAQARREGVWDGAATTLVAGRVVAMEEQARQQGVDVSDDGDGGIPASARVVSIQTETDLENRKVVLRCGWQLDMMSSEELLAW